MNPVNIPEKVVKALEAINLTQYEISLYLTLIKEGPLNARDLSEKSGVPYSRIYNILSLLLEKGFITRDDTERPSNFIAKPPDEALMLARKKMIDDFDAQSKIIVQELNDIYLKRFTAPFQIPLIVYRGKDQVFTKASTMLEDASESILIALADIHDIEENNIFDIVREKRKRGVVEIKILIEEREKEDPAKVPIINELCDVGEVRERDQIFGTGFTVDNADALIILKAKILGNLSYFGLKSEHQAFGSIANYYFSYLFDSAKEVEPLAGE